MTAHNLGDLRQHWDDLAKADAPWAIWTVDQVRHGRDMDAFWLSGVQEVALVMEERLEGIVVDRGRALDFGCGMGRLTQPLATYFDRVDGVDISKEMIRRARLHNAHDGRVAYHLNVRDDLALFPDDSFDFVLTLIVLQHIPQTLALGYLAEILRVMKSGGVAFLQVPVRQIAHDQTGTTLRRLPLWHPRRLWNKTRMVVLGPHDERFYRLRRLGLSERAIYRLFGVHPPMGMFLLQEHILREHLGQHGGEVLSWKVAGGWTDGVDSVLCAVRRR